MNLTATLGSCIIYKGLPLEAEKAAQQRLVEFVREEAKKTLDPAMSA